MDRSNLKYYWDLEQGTDEWHDLRLGKLTGTDAAVLLAKGRGIDSEGFSDGERTVIYRNASQLITGKDEESFNGNAHTDRGNSYEPLAIAAYEEKTWEQVRLCGFVELSHYIGFSPDGFVGDDGMVEVKSPAGKEYLRLFLEKTIDPKYFAQMQYGLWITGRAWCDNVYFNPDFGTCPLTVIRVERDEKTMGVFDEKMAAIVKKMDEILYKFK